jgi:DNA-binding transcriptional MerR regulator
MPNIQGEHTLSEVAVSIGVSPAWINKIQERTKVGGSTGVSGRKASFSDDDVEMFRNVKLLRTLDFSLDEIKEIHEEEKKIIKIGGYVKHHPDDKGGCRHIIHPFGFPYPMIELSERDISKAEADEYKKSAEKVFRISKEVTRRAKLLCDGLTEMTEKFIRNEAGE